jgi:hypothetical protein
MSEPAGRSLDLRALIAGLLVALIAIATPVTLIAHYISGEFTNSDHFVDTMAPLADNELIQDAVTKRATKEIVKRVPMTRLFEPYVEDSVRGVVQSHGFANVWVNANRRAHGHLVALLTGDNTGALQSKDGAVIVDLGDVVAAVKAELLGERFAWANRIPDVSVNYVIFQSEHLVQAQATMRWLDKSATWLPYVLAGLFVVALALSHSRRRLVFRQALAIALSMLVLAGVLAWLRSSYLDALPISSKGIPAAREVFDTLLHPLHMTLRYTLAGSLVVALGAWLVRRRTT